MSAGRLDWTATRYDAVDPATGARLIVTGAGDRWQWFVDVPKIGSDERSGVEKTSGAAKGAARKALDAAKGVK